MSPLLILVSKDYDEICAYIIFVNRGKMSRTQNSTCLKGVAVELMTNSELN